MYFSTMAMELKSKEDLDVLEPLNPGARDNEPPSGGRFNVKRVESPLSSPSSLHSPTESTDSPPGGQTPGGEEVGAGERSQVTFPHVEIQVEGEPVKTKGKCMGCIHNECNN